MPRDGAIIFNDLIGKVDVLAVNPKKIAHNMNGPCGARCRDLAKVL
jgi:hypothetical protein